MPPYSDGEATTWLPASASVVIVSISAAWPEPTASAPGMPSAVVTPPSSACSRASSALCVGFMMRV